MFEKKPKSVTLVNGVAQTKSRAAKWYAKVVAVAIAVDMLVRALEELYNGVR